MSIIKVAANVLLEIIDPVPTTSHNTLIIIDALTVKQLGSLLGGLGAFTLKCIPFNVDAVAAADGGRPRRWV